MKYKIYSFTVRLNMYQFCAQLFVAYFYCQPLTPSHDGFIVEPYESVLGINEGETIDLRPSCGFERGNQVSTLGWGGWQPGDIPAANHNMREVGVFEISRHISS